MQKNRAAGLSTIADDSKMVSGASGGSTLVFHDGNGASGGGQVFTQGSGSGDGGVDHDYDASCLL